MKYNTHTLWKEANTETRKQIAVDRIWADLVSILLHSGVNIAQNAMALDYLQKLNDLPVGQDPSHILYQASMWLEDISKNP